MEENKYNRGKIYKIISSHTDKIYIGSTCKKYLSQRLQGHKDDYKRWKNGKKTKTTSFDLLELGEVEIILIENYPCNSKDELHSRERHWIDQNKDNIINKVIPTRTVKEHYKDNIDRMKEKKKEFYKNNKDYYKEYVKDNKDHLNKYKNEHNRKEYICHCGHKTTNGSKYYHLKKHNNE